jgi:rhomboid protease GluP
VAVCIVLATVAVWLVHEALSTWAGVNTDLSLQDNGYAIHGQFWRLVTPLVVHYGILHIGLNMFALWQIGPPVEKVVGRLNFLAAYLLCGIGGQVVSDLHYGKGALSGGASGAIFGVIGVLIGNAVLTTQLEKAGHESSQEWRFDSGAVKFLALQGFVWIAATSLIPSLNIDNWAHIGGVGVGLVLGGAIAWWRTRPRSSEHS